MSKPCAWALRTGAKQSEVKTPLHPNAVHQHALYVIVTGYHDARGRPYDIHYCHCGDAMSFIPQGRRDDY